MLGTLSHLLAPPPPNGHWSEYVWVIGCCDVSRFILVASRKIFLRRLEEGFVSVMLFSIWILVCVLMPFCNHKLADMSFESQFCRCEIEWSKAPQFLIKSIRHLT